MNKRQTIIGMLLVVMLAVLMTTTASAQEEENIRSHVVQPGETLTSIAARYSVTLESLLFYNDLTVNSILERGQLILIPPTGGAPVIAGDTEIYTVQRGDTLYSIALRYDTTVEAILVTNTNIVSATNIRPGLELIVPALEIETTVVETATTATTEGQGGGLSTTSTTTNLVQQQTVVQQQPVIQPRVVVNGYYRVQFGDTMLAISRSFNVDVWNIARANGIFNLNRIYAGQLLRIPGYY